MGLSYLYEILKEIKEFKELNSETIIQMSKQASYIRYDQEETIFLEGEENYKVYFIYEGFATVSRISESGSEKIIHIFQKGNFINETCIDGRKTSTTVTVMENSKVLILRKNDVIKWMKNDFEFNKLIVESLTNKLRSSYRQIKNLGLKKINSRIVARLCKLARDYGEKNQESISIHIRLTQSQLASMVGTTRESTSRFLKQLEREGIIKQGINEINIIDLEKLKTYI